MHNFRSTRHGMSKSLHTAVIIVSNLNRKYTAIRMRAPGTKSLFCWFGGRGLGRYYNGKHSSAFALAEVAKEKFSIGNLVVA
jgi:hypothetical protein